MIKQYVNLLIPCLCVFCLWINSAGLQNNAISEIKADQTTQSLLDNREDSQTKQIVRAYFTDRELAYKVLRMFEDECLEISYDQGCIFMQVTAKDIRDLTNLGFAVVPDPRFDVHHNRVYDSEQKAGIPGYPCYRLVEESFTFLDSVCKAFPQLATIVDIGDSWDKTQGSGGYDLKVLRLTNSAIPGPKPKLYITGSIHAREYTTAELVNRFAYYLISNYGKDPDVTWMLDYHEFHGQVYANPDGRKYAEKGQMWRKNTNKNYCTTNPNQRGADLNRNFDYNWSASTDQCGETFSGASAASEPEVKAIQDYLKQIFPEKKQGIYIDLHAYAQTNMTSNAPELKVLARKFSYFNKYAYYDERGMTFDYAYNVVGIAGVLIELGTAFFEKCDFFESDLIPKHIPLFTYALRAAREPFTMPSGPDILNLSIKDKTLQATVTDTLYNGTTNVTLHTITAAEYYVKTPPWVNGATPITMKASDGNFDQKSEKVEAVLSVDDLKNPKTPIFVRAKDSGGFWGPVFAVYSDLTGSSSPIPHSASSLIAFKFSSSRLLPISLSFQAPGPTPVQFLILNLSGRVVATVTNITVSAGKHTISWDGKDNQKNSVPNGVYIGKATSLSGSCVSSFIVIR